MNDVLLIYKSISGFTKKYANWIQEEVGCTTKELKEISISEIQEYKTIIYGSGIYANRINGIKFITDNIEVLKSKNLIVFATGSTPSSAKEIVQQFQENNLPKEPIIKFFYFQSGMDLENMRFKQKFIIKILELFLKLKIKKSSVDRGTLASITRSHDHSKRESIAPLIEYVRSL